MMHPLELHEIDLVDEDTPRSTHSALPVLKVWNGIRWVNCNDVSPTIEQVTHEDTAIINDDEEDDTEYSITSKADKRRREKTINFAYKQRTNVYIKPDWVIAPGYSYPGPASIPHKLVTAAPAVKIIKKPKEDVAASIARSKAKLRRHDKTAFGQEEDNYTKKTHPRRHRATWDSLGMIAPGNYYPTGRIDFWPKGEPCKPFRRSFVDVLYAW
jgi:hypothetical protein